MKNPDLQRITYMAGLNAERNRQTKAGSVRFWVLVFVILGAMLSIEAVNSVRILTCPDRPARFPHNYVSKGVWSFWGFIRPLDTDSTDFTPALTALHNVLGGKLNLYSDFKMEGTSFIYPPTAVIELLGFGYLVREPQPSGERKEPDLSLGVKIWDLIGRLCAVGTLAVTVLLLRQIILNKKQWLFAILILAAFFPLRWAVMCVNIQTFITLLLVLLILTYSKSYNLLAGIIFGFAACLKPYLAMLILFAAFRKEWKFVAGAVATAALLIVASIIFVGIGPWKIYFFDILPLVGRGYGYYPNHSINGIVHRWLGHSTEMLLEAKSTIVTLATWMAAVVFIGLSICPRPLRLHKHRQDVNTPCKTTQAETLVLLRAVDVGIAILAVTLASPIVWDHYYAWCMVLFAVCLVIDYQMVLPQLFLGILTASYILLGTYFISAQSITSGPLTLINATHFCGAIGLLGSAWYAQSRLHYAQFE